MESNTDHESTPAQPTKPDDVDLESKTDSEGTPVENPSG
jgi:hypothetical protein